MDQIIENKIIDLIKTATIYDVDTDVVVHVENELKDWNEASDFPAIVVTSYGYMPVEWQVGAEQLAYTVFVAVLTYGKTVKEVKDQRSIIQKRVADTIRQNQQLTGLVDTTGKERAFQMNLIDVRFSHAGFGDHYEAVAHFRLTINTNLTGPF